MWQNQLAAVQWQAPSPSRGPPLPSIARRMGMGWGMAQLISASEIPLIKSGPQTGRESALWRPQPARRPRPVPFPFFRPVYRVGRSELEGNPSELGVTRAGSSTCTQSLLCSVIVGYPFDLEPLKRACLPVRLLPTESELISIDNWIALR